MPKKKILAVDDEKEMLALLEKRLLACGYEVFTASNGKDALGIAKRDHPDLIILDILMPEMDGSETAARLHEDPKTKDIPIIIFSNYDTPEVRKEAEKYGVRYILKANVTTRDLVELVKKEIGEKS